MNNSDDGGRDDFESVMAKMPIKLTLRDYFAAKAMAVSLMPATGPQGAQWAGKDQLPRLAEFAYWAADAMLAERASEAKAKAPQGLLEAVNALIDAEGGISIVSRKAEDAFERVRRIAERAK